MLAHYFLKAFVSPRIEIIIMENMGWYFFTQRIDINTIVIIKSSNGRSAYEKG